jgi:hypothetical protein
MPNMQEKQFLELLNAHVNESGACTLKFYVTYSKSLSGYVLCAESENMRTVFLSSARKERRVFASIDSAAKFLGLAGVRGFQCFNFKNFEE